MRENKPITEKTSITAQRLLNLYRQAHTIDGGWAVVNNIFVRDANAGVIAELIKLPNGNKLSEHIKNLRDGKTPMNGIERELMPYGGMMDLRLRVEQISDSDLQTLSEALSEFQSDPEHINQIRALPFVQSFGDKWIVGVRAALTGRDDLLEQWNHVATAARAYELWNHAYAIMTPPISERARAQIQAELSEFETYLPMFGEDGEKLLVKLRTFISSM
ncbi:MAG: hypothetical protein LBL75_02545 [Rickettsiales bacterium]|nr:hypothetical protein [Rickettsiales bacterium]